MTTSSTDTKRPRRKKVSVGTTAALVATAIETAAVEDKVPVTVPVTKELAGPYQFTVHVDGRELKSRNDEPGVSIGRRAAHVAGEHGYFVNCNPDAAFDVVSFDGKTRTVSVEAKPDALRRNEHYVPPDASERAYGTPLTWGQRKHPEEAALVAKNGGRPLNQAPSA